MAMGPAPAQTNNPLKLSCKRTKWISAAAQVEETQDGAVEL